jgi:hypothetical protein
MMTDDFDDGLEDLIGGEARAKPAVAFKPRLEQAEARNDFTERCMACGGSGRWRGFRECFKCKGTGKLVYRTSPEQRAKGRLKAAEKRELKAEQDAQWREEHKAEIEWLQRTAARQATRATPWTYPGELLGKLEQYGTLTDGQLAAVHKGMLRDEQFRQEREDRQMRANAPVEAGKIEAAFATARARAARPGMEGVWTRPLQLRAGDVDLTFQPGSIGSQWEGIIFVRYGDDKLGHIKAGTFFPRYECTDALKRAVIEICEDPHKACVAHAKAWSRCGICGQTLTNDESIERGIGPICASNYGW